MFLIILACAFILSLYYVVFTRYDTIKSALLLMYRLTLVLFVVLLFIIAAFRPQYYSSVFIYAIANIWLPSLANVDLLFSDLSEGLELPALPAIPSVSLSIRTVLGTLIGLLSAPALVVVCVRVSRKLFSGGYSEKWLFWKTDSMPVPTNNSTPLSDSLVYSVPSNSMQESFKSAYTLPTVNTPPEMPLYYHLLASTANQFIKTQNKLSDAVQALASRDKWTNVVAPTTILPETLPTPQYSLSLPPSAKAPVPTTNTPMTLELQQILPNLSQEEAKRLLTLQAQQRSEIAKQPVFLTEEEKLLPTHELYIRLKQQDLLKKENTFLQECPLLPSDVRTWSIADIKRWFRDQRHQMWAVKQLKRGKTLYVCPHCSRVRDQQTHKCVPLWARSTKNRDGLPLVEQMVASPTAQGNVRLSTQATPDLEKIQSMHSNLTAARNEVNQANERLRLAQQVASDSLIPAAPTLPPIPEELFFPYAHEMPSFENSVFPPDNTMNSTPFSDVAAASTQPSTSTPSASTQTFRLPTKFVFPT